MVNPSLYGYRIFLAERHLDVTKSKEEHFRAFLLEEYKAVQARLDFNRADMSRFEIGISVGIFAFYSWLLAAEIVDPIQTTLLLCAPVAIAIYNLKRLQWRKYGFAIREEYTRKIENYFYALEDPSILGDMSGYENFFGDKKSSQKEDSSRRSDWNIRDLGARVILSFTIILSGLSAINIWWNPIHALISCS